ncbi:MAG: hypothetical protein Fur0010_19110 [Bdellovibrio sp.]
MKKSIFVYLSMAAFIAALVFYLLRPLEEKSSPEIESVQVEEKPMVSPEPSAPEITTTPTTTPPSEEVVIKDETENYSELGKYCHNNPQEFIKQRLDNLFQQYGSSLVDQVEMVNIEFLKDGQPFRLQLSMDVNERGQDIQTISFYSLDRESLPVREKLPEQFANRNWDDIMEQVQRQYRLTFKEEHHLMVAPDGNQFRAVMRDGVITQYEDTGVVCRDGKCSCGDL